MTDNPFFWYWALGKDPETYPGQEDSREACIAAARNDGGDREGFTIVEANVRDYQTHVFDADDLLDRFEEANSDCWGDDGALMTPTVEQKRDLEDQVAAVFEAWLARHTICPVPCKFDQMRNQEYFAPAPADTVQTESPPPRLGEGQGEG